MLISTSIDHFRTQIESILDKDNHKIFDDLSYDEKWSITAAYMRDECDRTYSDVTFSIQQILDGLVYKNDTTFIIDVLKKELILEFQYDIEQFMENKKIHNEIFNEHFDSPSLRILNNFISEGKL